MPCYKFCLNVCHVACWWHSSVWGKLRKPEFRGWTSNTYVFTKLLFKGAALWVVRQEIKALIMLQCQKRRYESFFFLFFFFFVTLADRKIMKAAKKTFLGFWTMLCRIITLQRLHNRYCVCCFRRIIQFFTSLNNLLLCLLLLLFVLRLDLLIQSLVLVNKKERFLWLIFQLLILVLIKND